MMIRWLLSALLLVVAAAQVSEIKRMADHTVEEDYELPLPNTYIDSAKLPDAFNWGNISGVSYLTRSLNQHVPQYCGSCWAHGALSSLADRIKIARKGQGDDINLSIQYILNCGGSVAGSCHGGSHTGVYEFIKSHSGFVPYDTCQPYLACSADSEEGFCGNVDTTCSPVNTCRTCSGRLGPFFPTCVEIDEFPNATVAEYGKIHLDVDAIKAEIFARGPVSAVVAGQPLHNYRGGVFSDTNATRRTTHVVSLVGWGIDSAGVQHWIVRNSWGQYWGEMGNCRIEMGSNILGIESSIAWATPGNFTVINFPCYESGKNCGPVTHEYMDPSLDLQAVERRLLSVMLRNVSMIKL